MNFEEYWYALEYKTALISTNTNFLQPRPEVVTNFRFKDDVMSMASNGWCKKVYMCEWTTGAGGYVHDRTGEHSLIATTALLTSTSNSCQMFTGCSISRLDWRSLKFNVFLNSPELCLIIHRPTVVRATSDISNVAGMHAVLLPVSA